jgi:ketose-bisphosphate aldolase
MPQVPMRTLLSDALAGGYAASYCEAWNLESFQAVLQAAAELRAPVIAGFSGGFLGDNRRKTVERLSEYAGMGLALRHGPVPASLLLNESDNFAQIREAIELGFNAVMVDNEHVPFEQYRRLVRQVVDLAHANNVFVEAQVGRLPHGSDPNGSHAEFTDAGLAREFVEETGVDALAVAVGNVHILTSGSAALDFAALERIRDAVKIPLVLHGGTGLPLDCLQQAIRLGVAKLNFGTIFKQVFLAAVREKLAAYREPMNPHPYVGMGGHEDVLVAGRDAMAAEVRRILLLTGAAGKAGRLEPAGVSMTERN